MVEMEQQNEHIQGPFHWSEEKHKCSNRQKMHHYPRSKVIPVVEEQVCAVNETRIEGKLAWSEVQAESGGRRG